MAPGQGESGEDRARPQERPGVSVHEAAGLRAEGEAAVLGPREKAYVADNVEGGMEAWQEAGLPMQLIDGRVA